MLTTWRPNLPRHVTRRSLACILPGGGILDIVGLNVIPGNHEAVNGYGKGFEMPEKSKGFLWWAGIVIVSFLFGPGKNAFQSESVLVPIIVIFGIVWTASVCFLWYWISGIRIKRGIMMRCLGTLCFVYGSIAPLLSADPGPFHKEPFWGSVLVATVSSIVLLGASYFAMFCKDNSKKQASPI